jgi:tetratricopeptide (TPR) repeat protein
LPADAASETPTSQALLPVGLLDTSQIEESVERQLRASFDLLTQKRETAGTPPSELANAYGELGKLLMSARDFDLAEPYFLNAQALAPRDRRWPYYLGHLYKNKGVLDQAAASFQRALELDEHDVPTLFWLGDLCVLDGRPAEAAQLFSRALATDPRNLPARFGLGRAALAQRDFKGAVDHFEAVLGLEKNAVGVHYPLALAYRGLGETAKAEAHARTRGESDLLPVDPLMDELRALLQSAVSYELAGTRALNGGDWRTAMAEFRKGLALEPSSAALRHKLGTALYLSGDVRAAEGTFADVVRESPTYAKAHYSLGVLLAAQGRDEEAIARLSGAVGHEPAYVDAHVGLAELLRKSGRLREAVAHYDRALALDPRISAAALGRALTLIRLQRYTEALDRLRGSVRGHPEEPWFAHALARLLAAAPDDRVRDGRQALAVIESLSEQDRRLDLGETMAMALAEVGRYEEAATWQRHAIEAARKTGQTDLAVVMAERLRLYESDRPSRTPWRPEELR